jgi:hypothetical protein
VQPTVFELVVVTGLVLRRLGLAGMLGRSNGVARSILAVATVPTIGLILVVTSLATLSIAYGLDHGAPGHDLGSHAALNDTGSTR